MPTLIVLSTTALQWTLKEYVRTEGKTPNRHIKPSAQLPFSQENGIQKYRDSVKMGVENKLNRLIVRKPTQPVTPLPPVPAPNLAAINRCLEDETVAEPNNYLTVLRQFNLASGDRLLDRLLNSTAAYIVPFGSECYNSTGITSVDIECASGILESLPGSESLQWSDRAQEARQRQQVIVYSWPAHVSSFREVYAVIAYPQLSESPGTPVKAPGTINRIFYELVVSVSGAFKDIADCSFDKIYKDFSGDLQDLLFGSEEGEADIEEDTFYDVTRGAGRYLNSYLALCLLPLLH
ncbi:hypothetical protein BDD12DRAFT_891822 [Trichophaea hybrida]|nr:hypothetical protein BDD12DRAFT_891822 [Trichophaea hybrida]